MHAKRLLTLLLLLTLLGSACGSSPSATAPATTSGAVAHGTATAATPVAGNGEATAPPATAAPAPGAGATRTRPTPAVPSGTVVEDTATGLSLSHPTYLWQVTPPAGWTISYDAGFELHASSPDQDVFVRLQAQRWPQLDASPIDARAYVGYWKHFEYGDVFPLFADGVQVAELDTAHEKPGGPYLFYEFRDGRRDVHHLQIYAAAGGPNSAMIATWTSGDQIDEARDTMRAILDSFELVEVTQ